MNTPATATPIDPMGLPPLQLSMETLGEFRKQPVGARFTLAEENHATVYRKVRYSPGVKVNGRNMADLMGELSPYHTVCSQCPASQTGKRNRGGRVCTERYVHEVPCRTPAEDQSMLIVTEHAAFVAALEGFVSW